MIAAFLLLGLASQDFEVAARACSWEQLEQAFDRSWALPDDARERRLLAAMRELAVQEYMDEGKPRCLGDLIAEARTVPSSGRAAWLEQVEARAPRLMGPWGAALRELLLDDQLHSASWRPGTDSPRDGILTLEGWEYENRTSGAWKAMRKTPRFEQGAALYMTDLASVKAVENDYRQYHSNIGAEYREIYPTESGHLRGTDAAARPFRYMQIFFECDLPFPFSSYECRLNILNRLDEDGILRTDIYSTSADFHYMAGQDVFLPVVNSAGESVAYLVVRDFGFDLSGVPDGSKHRAEALRSTLGNMKRNLVGREGKLPFPAPEAALEGVRLRGRK